VINTETEKPPGKFLGGPPFYPEANGIPAI
jgi:hypothetical protein